MKAIKLNYNDAIRLSENLRTLIENHNLNANQVAQALGIPIMTIRRLLSGETTDPRISTLKLIADHFDITVDSLIDNCGRFPPNAPKRKTKPFFIPILDWQIVEKMNSIRDINLNKWEVWQPISLNKNDTIGENSFALESRPSMYPRFPQGTIFVIDSSVSPTDGDIVLVKIRENNELTLRELMIDPPEWKLQSIVSECNTFSYSRKNHEIVGVVLLTMLYNRKVYS